MMCWDGDSSMLWHQRLRHIFIERIKRLINGGYSGLYIFQDLGLKLNQTIITIFFNKTLKNKMVKKKQDWIQTHNTRLDETYDPVVTCKPNIKTRRILSLLNTKKENVVIPNVFGFSLN